LGEGLGAWRLGGVKFARSARVHTLLCPNPVDFVVWANKSQAPRRQAPRPFPGPQILSHLRVSESLVFPITSSSCPSLTLPFHHLNLSSGRTNHKRQGAKRQGPFQILSHLLFLNLSVFSQSGRIARLGEQITGAKAPSAKALSRSSLISCF
jgi:hypothetical protein